MDVTPVRLIHHVLDSSDIRVEQFSETLGPEGEPIPDLIGDQRNNVCQQKHRLASDEWNK